VIAFGAHCHRVTPLKEEVKMHSLTSRFLRDESGATATEYAMLLVFVALAIAVAAQTFGATLGDLFTRAGTTLTNIQIPTP
jgi:pilus assembly protein Flp/PilA